MAEFEPTSFLLQASAYTTGTLHQSTAQLLISWVAHSPRSKFFSDRCDIIWVSTGLQVQNIQKENISGQVHNKTQPPALIDANSL